MPLSCRLAACALLALAALAFFAPSANAEDTYARNYETQITGFGLTGGISVDAADRPWVIDAESGSALSQYAAFPSLAKIGEQNGQGHFKDFSGYANTAVDKSNGHLYAVNTGEGANIQVFDPVNFLDEWSVPGGTSWVAVDNSTEPTQGRVYAATYGEPRVEAFTAGGAPAPFSCAACSYIQGNVITGTPGAPFGSLYGVATDSHGNIFVNNPSGKAVDEFKPSGEFVQSFPRSGTGIAVDTSTDHLIVFDNGTLYEYSASGQLLFVHQGGAPGEELRGGYSYAGMGVDSEGHLFFPNGDVVDVFSPAFILPKITYQPPSVQRNTATLNATVDPNGGKNITACHAEYGTDTSYNIGSLPCSPDPSGSNFASATPISIGLSNLTTDTTYHYRVIASNSKVTQVGEDQTYTTPPAVAGMTTEPATDITNESATLHGSYTGDGLDVHYYFEYGTSAKYGHQVPVPSTDNGEGAGQQSVPPLPVENLTPGATYHFRLDASNSTGTAFGPDETFTTYQGPAIEGLSSSDVTANSAILHAKINPHGLPVGTETDCYFEYGPTSAYGVSVPCSDALSGTSGVDTQVEIGGLQSGSAYHFRVTANNRWGSATSEDQSFEFFPPACPNAAVRQQTGSSYLPDCRAYELVSPANANGTLFFTGGPNTGHATSPSRLSFIGAYSSPAGANPTGGIGDLYVATRQSTGWSTSYVGLHGNQATCVGGPPNRPGSRYETSPIKLLNSVLTDSAMNRFVDFVDGAAVGCFANYNGVQDSSGALATASNIGNVWAADGSPLGQLPSQFATDQARAAMTCPQNLDLTGEWGECRGDVATSADLSHYVFSSYLYNYAAGGSDAEPGGAFDLNVDTGSVKRISVLMDGGAISPGHADKPSLHEETFIRFPAVSSDGSHILMSSPASAPLCNNFNAAPCSRYTDGPLHLYMSIDDGPAYVVSESEITHQDVAAHFVGMTPDGSTVYFTTAQHLTAEDPGHVGSSLYMWSAEKAQKNEPPLTLISKANPDSPAGAGDTGDCQPIQEWTTKCGVETFNPNYYAEAAAGKGGNGLSDSGLAANGDIYFFSPEQLAGDHGIAGQQNLYDYRDGHLQFVTSFSLPETCPGSIDEDGTELEGECSPGSTCLVKDGFTGHSFLKDILACSEGPIARLEVTPDDSHMAFVTANPVTSYDNVNVGGSCRSGMHGTRSGEKRCTEMYTYTPATGALVCTSCNPTGAPPTSDVYASQDGLFLTDDGRTFFATEESLVPEDTNEGIDVYEYAEGRPHLITPGTGTATAGNTENPVGIQQAAGFVGVSADGGDVYFATYDVLTSEDRNGDFLKFYDARTNGGFPQPAPIQPCAAAEECHGSGTEAPSPIAQGSAAWLAGGNAAQAHRHKVSSAHRKRRKHRGRRHRRSR